MKGLFAILMLLTFLMAGPIVTAIGQTSGTDRVRCCVRGKCMYTTKAACQKFRGVVVEDCSQCR
jgi:hypothetical protein